MKNLLKISILLTTMTVVMMNFWGCSKEETESKDSLVSGGFNGKISATVDDEDWDLSPVKQVVPWNSPEIDMENGILLGKQMGEPVSFSSNKFTVSLLDPPPASVDMVSIKYAFENFLNLSGKLKYSDPDVMVADVDFLAYTNDGFSGYFLNTTTDKKTTCFYIYVESDVTVTGGSNVSVSLEEGWNRIYYTEGGSGKYTTKAPSGNLKWYYYNFF